MDQSSKKVKYPIDSFEHVVCPACHAVDRGSPLDSPGNSLRRFFNALLLLMIGIPPFRTWKRCAACGAQFIHRFTIDCPRCGGCGRKVQVRGEKCNSCGWQLP